MKTNIKTLLTLLILFCSVTLFAQDKKAQISALIKQGTAFHDAGKYDDAIAKYDEALKLDPDNLGAVYEKAFTLTSSGKPDMAIPYLEKVIAGNVEPAAYDLLGSIYDDKNDFDKATKYYTQGIAAFPKYQRLHFNLSISYIRQKKYAEGEAQAIEAIKLDPRHASSHRAYALATYGSGKHENSLLAWCSFLMMEPQTTRSVEACKYIKHMLYYSVKGNNIVMKGTDAESNAQQMAIAMSVNTGLVIANKVNNNAPVTALDSLTAPLSTIFQLVADKKEKNDTPFFSKYFAEYFGALAKTEHMAAFDHYITLSVYRDEDIAWLKAHDAEIKGLSTWVNTTKREFE